MTTRRTPSPRFARSKGRPVLRLTLDDHEILRQVCRHRVLDSESIRALFPNRSAQNITRRLKILFNARYLDRPRQQTDGQRYEGGSAPLVYALDREGARVLRDLYGARLSVDHWSQKNREFRGRNIQHRLEPARFMVALELCVRARPEIELTHFDELLRMFAPEKWRRSRTPTTVRTMVDWYGYRETEGTAPDNIFGLRYLNREPGENQRFLFLELDRGTETIEPGLRKVRSRSFFRDSSILRKFVIYAQAFKNGAHQNLFGLPVFQVLIVTTTPKRVLDMQQAYQRHLAREPHAAKPGLFIFTDQETITAYNGDVLSLPYVNARGKEVRIN